MSIADVLKKRDAGLAAMADNIDTNLKTGDFTAAEAMLADYEAKVKETTPGGACNDPMFYWFSLLVARRAESDEALVRKASPNDKPLVYEDMNYKKALAYADGHRAELSERFRRVGEAVKANIEKDVTYSRAVASMAAATTAAEYRRVAELFASVAGYQDAEQKQAECLTAAKKSEDKERRQREQEAAYRALLDRMKKASTVGEYRELIAAFGGMKGYKDAKQKGEECSAKLAELEAYEKACRYLSEGKSIDALREAIGIFKEMTGFREANAKLTEAKRTLAALQDAAAFKDICAKAQKAKTVPALESVIALFEGMGSYPGAAEQIADCHRRIDDIHAAEDEENRKKIAAAAAAAEEQRKVEAAAFDKTIYDFEKAPRTEAWCREAEELPARIPNALRPYIKTEALISELVKQARAKVQEMADAKVAELKQEIASFEASVASLDKAPRTESWCRLVAQHREKYKGSSMEFQTACLTGDAKLSSLEKEVPHVKAALEADEKLLTLGDVPKKSRNEQWCKKVDDVQASIKQASRAYMSQIGLLSELQKNVDALRNQWEKEKRAKKRADFEGEVAALSEEIRRLQAAPRTASWCSDVEDCRKKLQRTAEMRRACASHEPALREMEAEFPAIRSAMELDVKILKLQRTAASGRDDAWVQAVEAAQREAEAPYAKYLQEGEALKRLAADAREVVRAAQREQKAEKNKKLFRFLVLGLSPLAVFVAAMIMGLVNSAEDNLKWIVVGVAGLVLCGIRALCSKGIPRLIFSLVTFAGAVTAVIMGEHTVVLTLSAASVVFFVVSIIFGGDMFFTCKSYSASTLVKNTSWGRTLSREEESYLRKRVSRNITVGRLAWFTELIGFLATALVSTGFLVYPSWGLWAMVMAGVAIGGGAIAYFVCNMDDFGILGSILWLLLFATLGGFLIFISRETAYIALPLVVMDIALMIVVGVWIYNEHDEDGAGALFVIGGLIMATLLILSIVWCASVWGTTAVKVNTTEETVRYRLDRSEGTFTASYQAGAATLDKVNAPNATTVVVGEGFEVLDEYALSSCKDMVTLYIPSSVTRLVGGGADNGGAIAKCKNLKTVYIGFNADGSKCEVTSQLKVIESFVFANSPVKTIYFNGTQAEWQAIEQVKSESSFKSQEWTMGIYNAYEVICNDGTLEVEADQ